MRIGFQVEGPTDRVVLPDLVRRILGVEIEEHVFRKRVGGVDEVLRTLKASVMDAWRNACDALLVHVDGNGTTPHYEHAREKAKDCRYCRIRRGIPRTPKDYNPHFRVLIGVPIKELEAWLLTIAGRRFHGPAQSLPRRRAKELLWGTLQPDRQTVQQVWSELFPRIGPVELGQLASTQPSFASFHAEVRRLAARRTRGVG